MKIHIKNKIQKSVKAFLLEHVPELRLILTTDPQDIYWVDIIKHIKESDISDKSVVYPPCQIKNSKLDDYSYITRNSRISMTNIGKFCSIGSNFVSGFGIHPTNGISTSPYFYSTKKQNGASISATDKIKEREWINIGNDVFIGMNVTVLDGVSIGDGAVIGAGAVVSKDIPPYAIAVGCPIQIIGYRFEENVIEKLLNIEWWDKDEEDYLEIEKLFFDVDQYISLMNKSK